MFSLTTQEKKVILFVSAMALLGLSVSSFQKASPAFQKLIQPADYQNIPDINRATFQDLLQIKGIGPVLAGKIISYRQAHGPFSSIEELSGVKGIGEFKYNQIKDSVSVGKN